MNTKKVWILFLLFYVGVTDQNCFSADEDGFRSLTVGGSRTLNQFVGLSHDVAEKTLEPQLNEGIRLSWNLGLGYSLIQSDPGLAEGLYSGSAGLGVEFIPDWRMSLTLGYDSMAAESYSHGAANIKIERVWHFGSSKPYFVRGDLDEDLHDEADEDWAEEEKDARYEAQRNPADATAFYRHERAKKLSALQKKWRLESDGLLDEDISEEQLNTDYPQLRIGYLLGFNLHDVQAKSNRVPSKASIPAQAIVMNQYQYGPEITYSPHFGTQYQVAFSYFMYSAPVDSFVDQLNLADSARMPTFPTSDLSVWSNQLLAFPSWLAYLSGSWSVGNRDRFDLKGALAQYVISAQSMTFGLSPYYTHDFRHHWSGGVGMGVVSDFKSPDLIKSVSGLIGLSYHY